MSLHKRPLMSEEITVRKEAARTLFHLTTTLPREKAHVQSHVDVDRRPGRPEEADA